MSLTCLFADKDDIDCNKRQAYRFLGICGEAGQETERLYEKCLALVREKACFGAVYRKTALEFIGEKTVKLDFCSIESEALRKNLEGCREAFVFAATVGAEVDRLLLRLSCLSKGEAAMADCIASSLTEGWCDKVNEKIADGKRLAPRFSPGYGGVELRHQKALLDFLGAEKYLGLTLTDSFFMLPKKSVTAIIGIKEEEK